MAMTAQTTPANGHTYKATDGLWYDLRDAADYKAMSALLDASWHAKYGPVHSDGTTCGTSAAVAAVEDLRPAGSRGGTQQVADPAAKAQLAEALAYVASYVGTWGLPLDIRSDPRFGTKWMRLSPRQVEALLAGKARDMARAVVQAERQALADELRADDAYLASQAPAPAAKTWRPAARVEQDGMYLMPDGTVVKVQAAKVSGSGHLYAKRLVVDGGHGSFVYAPGLVSRLDASMRMTLDEAKAYGKLYGVCCRCGSPLTDEKSIADGIGPVCADKGWA